MKDHKLVVDYVNRSAPDISDPMCCRLNFGYRAQAEKNKVAEAQETEAKSKARGSEC